MALTAGGFLIHTALATPEELATGTLGSADLAVNGYDESASTETIRAALPGAQVSSAYAIDYTNVIEGTTVYNRFLETSAPANQEPLAPRYKLLKGRMPHAANEVAIHPDMAGEFGVGLGGELVIDKIHARLKVVGVQVVKEDLRNVQALVGPGTFHGRTDGFSLDWLIKLPPEISIAEARKALRPAGVFEVNTRADFVSERVREKRTQTGVAFGAAAMALFGTGLIAAAAFGVGARRQLRVLGLVGSSGGEPQHVRATVLWGGAATGLLGSIVGVGAAVVLAYAAHPHLSGIVHRIVPGLRLPWAIMAGGIVLGTVAATLSALGPARSAARLSTVDALASRFRAPLPPGKLAGRGIAAVVVGSIFTALATIWNQDKIVAGALVVTLAGFLFTIPILVTWIGRTPARLPASLRFAARQTARYGRRTGAAVAAATLALTAPVAIAAFTLSDEAFQTRYIPIAKDQMALGLSPDATSKIDDVLVAAKKALTGSVGGVFANGAASADSPGLKAELFALVQEPVQVAGSGTNAVSVTPLQVGDADLLRALRAESGIAALRAGKVIAIGAVVEHGTVRVLRREAGAALSKEPLQEPLVLPAYVVAKHPTIIQDTPRYVISPDVAARYHLHSRLPNAAILRGRHALTKPEIKRVKHAVASFDGASATSRDEMMFPATTARLAVTGAATGVALIIVAVAVALVGAEARREHTMLVAVGAGPGTRRKTVAANAFFVSAIAGVLALPAGFLPVAIIEIARTVNQPIIVPWSVLGIVALGAPLIAAAIAAVSSREPTPRSLLQPIW